VAQRILVVDDENDVQLVIKTALQSEGFDVATASNGPDALAEVANRQPDLIVLDVMMPGRDGFLVCREIRRTSDVPIIMLTAKASEMNKVVGLEIGADDYVTKPFSVMELVARIKAVLRRAAPQQDAETPEEDVIRRGELTIDRTRREVLAGEEAIELTTREFELLYFLASNPGIVFTREQILDRVWGNESIVVDRAIDVHIRHLRKKIEPRPDSPCFITTIRGVGYKFAE